MPQLSAKDVWKKVLDEAHRELPQETIRTWLQPAEPIALDDRALVIGAVDQFAADWASAKYSETLSRLAAGVTGRPVAVSFTVQEARRELDRMGVAYFFTQGIVGPESQQIFLHDPFGNMIELHQIGTCRCDSARREAVAGKMA